MCTPTSHHSKDPKNAPEMARFRVFAMLFPSNTGHARLGFAITTQTRRTRHFGRVLRVWPSLNTETCPKQHVLVFSLLSSLLSNESRPFCVQNGLFSLLNFLSSSLPHPPLPRTR